MRVRDEAGFVGGFEALPFGFLVFVAGTLLLVNAWGVFDCHLAASAAAREAVRAFVEADGTDAAAQQAGDDAALRAIQGQGKAPDRTSISWTGAHLARCAPVVATVSYRVPLISVPWIGAFGGGVLTTSARHREIVDPYRRGMATDGFDPRACNA